MRCSIQKPGKENPLLIIAEKPDVARQFAAALGCSLSNGTYSGGGIEITNCLGHLYELCEPEDYDEKFKSWETVPVIPEEFRYITSRQKSKQASIVRSLLRKHRDDEILIATDADREGEIIARECLRDAGITDLSRARRFWVSQALTPEVIRDGVKNALPLSSELYEKLSAQGFARQHSDWLTGLNFTRYISNAAGRKLPVGRVQTAVLAAIDERCRQIENFRSEKYYEHWGTFSSGENSCKGIHFYDNDITQFADSSLHDTLSALKRQKAELIETKREQKKNPAPQLYNLNELQKDAFKKFGYSAEETLSIVQSLYEDRKCVSYPRTPSRVMGSQNVELCKKIFETLSRTNTWMQDILAVSDISLSNSRVFNDAKLEAHHALIPLSDIPDKSSENEKNIYSLILQRFAVAFAPDFLYEKQTADVEIVRQYRFRITGRKVISEGWKKFQRQDDSDETDSEQDISGINFDKLILTEIETEEKWTRPPKHFNEASILAFMENPKNEDERFGRLVGLGTPATRHTFIPKLLKSGYISTEKKNILITSLGRNLLGAIKESGIRSIADISETTTWEQRLDNDPAKFEAEIREYVSLSVANPFSADIRSDEDAACPVCGKPIQKNERGWYCSGYKEGCKFKIWATVAGTRLSDKDALLLCSGQRTPVKKFTSKTGKKFSASLYLAPDESQTPATKFHFEDTRTETGLTCPACGKPLIKNDRSWYCQGYKDGCKFTVWSTVAGTRLSDKDMSALLTDGKTGLKKFRSKAGKQFEARLYMDDAFKINFSFDEKEKHDSP